MLTGEERDRVRERLLALAEADPVVVGAAITGSYVEGASDEWSDVDLVFAIDGEVEPALESWTRRLYDELEARHHWDLRWAGTVYRVFLLASGLEVDIAFTPRPTSVRAGQSGAPSSGRRSSFGRRHHRIATSSSA